MEQLLHHLRVMAQEIGPRGSTTPGEKKASEYVAKVFGDIGLNAERMPFKSITTFSWLYAILYGLFPLAAMVYPENVTLASLLTLGGLVLFALENNSVEALSRLLPKRDSQNVLAKIKAQQDNRRVVVVSAHVDSSRSALNFRQDMVKNFRLSFQIMTGAMVVEAAAYLVAAILRWAGMGSFNRWLWYLTWPSALYLAITVVLLVHRETHGQYTHGANDNASGTSVMLEVARELADQPCNKVDVWCLATGCEEVGTVGMIRFLDDALLPIRRGDIINLDNLGTGQLKIVTGEGMTKVWPCTPDLVALAVDVAQQQKIPAEPSDYRIMPTDAQPALVHGYRAVSIMAMDERGLLPNWHWITDTIEHVQGQNLVHAKDLVVGMIREIDRRAQEPVQS